MNNPLKFIDPSGYGACDDPQYAEDLCAYYEPSEKEMISQIKSYLFTKYGWKVNNVSTG